MLSGLLAALLPVFAGLLLRRLLPPLPTSSSSPGTVMAGISYGLKNRLAGAIHSKAQYLDELTDRLDAVQPAGDARLVFHAGAPMDGPAGTGAGQAGRGSVLVDTVHLRVYLQAGTADSPAWVPWGQQAS